MMMDPMGWSPAMMVTMAVFGLLVLGAIVTGIVFLTRTLSRQDTGHAQENRAVGILEERFARGDIDREEYESRRHLLSQG